MRLHGVRMAMRVPLVAAVALAVIGAALATRSEATPTGLARTAKAPPPVLGVSYRSPRGMLAWFDPLTLRILPGRKAPLGGHLGSWAFSADRALLAIARCAGEWERKPGIRFVDARAMRVLGDLRLSPVQGCADALTWVRPDRLLVVVRTPSEAELVVVDPGARRVLRREALPDGPSAIGRTRDGLVLLLGNVGSIGPARLAIVDVEGVARVATVRRVLAGKWSTRAAPATRHERSRRASPSIRTAGGRFSSQRLVQSPGSTSRPSPSPITRSIGRRCWSGF